LERAARFLFLQRNAFGGKISGRSFGVSPDRPAKFNLSTLEPMLEDVHARLSGVVIECLPYAEFLTRYDRASALFYLDPPYWGCEDDYGKAMFTPQDFETLAGWMKAAEGKALLSINDVLEIREIFAGLSMEEVQVTYTVARKETARGKRGELLIRNF
jgi:DNA adenine methylase